MNIFQLISFLLASIIISFSFSAAQTADSSPFKTDRSMETVLLGCGAAAGITALAILVNIDPLTQEQLGGLDKNDVNSFDRAFIGPFQDDYLSDAFLYSSYLIPLTFLTNSEAKNDFEDLSLMYGEVLLLNAGINGIVKGLSGRTRPFVYDPLSPFEEKTTIDAQLSFYSGHTSTTAAVYFFTASVFNEYLNDNTIKVLIWSAAALIPAVTGFSRVNTHWHFPTDVIVGYIVGAAIGYLIPLIHKNKDENIDASNPAENIYKPIIRFQFKF